MNLILKNIKEFYLYIVLYIIGLLFLSFSVGSVIHLAKDFQTEIYKDLNQFNSGTIPLNMVYLSNYKNTKLIIIIQTQCLLNLIMELK